MACPVPPEHLVQADQLDSRVGPETRVLPELVVVMDLLVHLGRRDQGAGWGLLVLMEPRALLVLMGTPVQSEELVIQDQKGSKEIPDLLVQ